MKVISEILKNSNGKSEYGLYLKALIHRLEGNIHESLETFKQCHILNPNNIACQKQVGRAL
jgi:Bardet-Biedl syndrome 4 protein